MDALSVSWNATKFKVKQLTIKNQLNFCYGVGLTFGDDMTTMTK